MLERLNDQLQVKLQWAEEDRTPPSDGEAVLIATLVIVSEDQWNIRVSASLLLHDLPLMFHRCGPLVLTVLRSC